MHVINFSITPFTYSETFKESEGTAVLSKDHLQISFAVHVTFKVNEDMGKEFVERYTTLTHEENPDETVKVSYSNFAKERIRTISRMAVEKYNWQEMQEQTQIIQDDVDKSVRKFCEKTPFEIISISVGNIQFPKPVADSVSEAQAASQILARKQLEIKQSEADALKRVAEAKGIADAMTIVKKELTPEYLQYLAIEAQKAMVGSPNHTTVYIPTGNLGVPLVGTFDVKGNTNESPKKP